MEIMGDKLHYMLTEHVGTQAVSLPEGNNVTKVRLVTGRNAAFTLQYEITRCKWQTVSKQQISNNKMVK